ncbi:hypothetical protein D3C72_1336300 [compost metagenome]
MLADIFDIARVRVNDGDGAILSQEQHAQGLTHDVGSSDHNCMLAAQISTQSRFGQDDTPLRSAWNHGALVTVQ